jgi:predicted dehydrogenase
MTATVAVLGLGSIGMRHGRNLLADGIGVIGFDPDGARRAQFEQAGGRTGASRDAVLAEAGAAVIASPSGWHLDDLAASIGAGLHVFVEKPLAHSAQGVAGLLARARSARQVVFAGLMLRWHAGVERARAALAQGAIGQPLWARALYGSWLPAWRPQSDYRAGYAADPASGGVLFDLVHEFDLLHHILGRAEVAAAVARRSGLLDMPSEDVAEVIFRHGSGLLSTLHVDYLSRPPVRELEIGGADGRLLVDLNSRRFRQVDAGGAIVADIVLPGSYAEDYVAEMRDFIACIEGRAVPRCDGEEALAVLEQVVAARRLCGLPETGEGK